MEGPQTPKLCLGLGRVNDVTMREVKQLGVNYVLRGGPRIPWQEAELRTMMDSYKAAGLTLANLMIGGFNNAIYGKPGRDEEIEKVRNLSGLPAKSDCLSSSTTSTRIAPWKATTARREIRHRLYGIRLRAHEGSPSASQRKARIRSTKCGGMSLTSSKRSCPLPRNRTCVWPCIPTIHRLP